MFNPILKSAKSGHHRFDVDLYLFDASDGKWCHWSFQPDGVDLAIVSPSLAAARRSSASRRSPQQIGFIPAHRMPTPVSVPVVKRLTRLVAPDPTRPAPDSRLSFASSNGKSLRHLRCPTFHRRRDQGVALTRRRFARD